MTDPCRARSIPTLSNLLQWQAELRRANLAVGNFVIEYSSSSIERYDIEAVFAAQKLHYARQIKQAVTKEVEWFASTISVPKSIHQRLPTASVNAFRSLVHEHGYLDKLQGLEMAPDELARVVGRRYLSDQHMTWAAEKLNERQGDILCTYLNYISNIPRYCQKIMRGKSTKPNKLLFLLNVGTSGSAKTFIGTKTRAGCHFAVAIYDSLDKTLIYGDSLGWCPPDGLKNVINQYSKELYNSDITNLQIDECHSSKSTLNGVHHCDTGCKAFYPLQKDGDICGVVSIIMSCIICLAPDFANFILSTEYLSRHNYPNLYLAQPTKYHKYLRSTLAVWMAESYINITYILPSSWRDGSKLNDVSSDSDSDEDIPRIEITDENSNGSDQKEGKPTSLKIPGIAKEQPTTKAEKTSAANLKPDSFDCPICYKNFNVKSNLARHIKRWHKDNTEVLNSMAKGACICLECGKRCFKISHLREHLTATHDFTFAIEKEDHQNEEGLFTCFCLFS